MELSRTVNTVETLGRKVTLYLPLIKKYKKREVGWSSGEFTLWISVRCNLQEQKVNTLRHEI